jgi:hypothetical protein
MRAPEEIPIPKPEVGSSNLPGAIAGRGFQRMDVFWISPVLRRCYAICNKKPVLYVSAAMETRGSSFNKCLRQSST